MSEPAAPVATEPAALTQEALNALSPDDRLKWEAGGDWPEPAKVTTTAAEGDEDAEPAATTATTNGETVTAAVTTTTTAPPEAAKLAAERSSGKVSRQQQINDLIRKSTEADLRAKALEDKLAALEAGKPAAEPKAEPAKADTFQPTRPKPTDTEFESYAEFVDALTDWKIEQRDAKVAFESEKSQRATAETSAREAFTAKASAWIQQRDAFIDENPTKSEALLSFLDNVHAGTPIGDVIMTSNVGAKIADYLAGNPTEAGRIRALGPVDALLALGEISATYKNSLTSASASAGPAAKLVTTAPAPPTTLSARSAAPADPAAAAVDRGDFSAFEAEENRRALASTR